MSKEFSGERRGVKEAQLFLILSLYGLEIRFSVWGYYSEGSITAYVQSSLVYMYVWMDVCVCANVMFQLLTGKIIEAKSGVDWKHSTVYCSTLKCLQVIGSLLFKLSSI